MINRLNTSDDRGIIDPPRLAAGQQQYIWAVPGFLAGLHGIYIHRRKLCVCVWEKYGFFLNFFLSSPPQHPPYSPKMDYLIFWSSLSISRTLHSTQQQDIIEALYGGCCVCSFLLEHFEPFVFFTVQILIYIYYTHIVFNEPKCIYLTVLYTFICFCIYI